MGRIVHIVALVLVLVSFSLAHRGRIVTLDKETANQQVNLGENDELHIKLPSNPSTGYHWYPEYDHRLLELTSKTCKFPEEGRRLGVGRGCITTMTFVSRAEGQSAKIHVRHMRPWEHGQPAREEVTFTVFAEKPFRRFAVEDKSALPQGP
eukprot:RCo052158